MTQLSLQERPPVVRMGETGKKWVEIPGINHLCPKQIIFFKNKYIYVCLNSRIKASANFVRLGCEVGKGFYEYEVKFQPECDSKNMCFRLLNSCWDSYGQVKTFDGTVLYLPIKLPDKVRIEIIWIFCIANLFCSIAHPQNIFREFLSSLSFLLFQNGLSLPFLPLCMFSCYSRQFQL